ncbi:BTB domain and ankyrin repeat containing protein [Pyrenophora teres f. maculata]|nr:BTB domain and ankyrin repeat containing protein [Pyrenophora teres f. maculata]
MSGYLWKYYLEDDVDSFRHVLAAPTQSHRAPTQKGFAGWQGGVSGGAVNGSPGSYNASPITSVKGRKMGLGAAANLTRFDINSRDAAGMTILHHAASSTADSAVDFAQALLDHPWTDVYIQDAENGWTALHRAFYFGNIAIARLILNRDAQDILGQGASGFNQHARGLVKIKDKEGYGPLDLFSMTIKDRTLRPEEAPVIDSDSDDEMAHGDSGDVDDEMRKRLIAPPVLLEGDEVYTFGSNKNVTLGFGDEDDRQFPERITLRRPDHLLQRFYKEHRDQHNQYLAAMGMPIQDAGPQQARSTVDLPTHIRNTPIVIQDVRMSKLHTAILTTDPISNLYMCGHGPGGRLGTGNETTRYQFTCIESGGLGQKKVAAVALGQNHTLAITEEGEIFSWGNNAYGQLGYTLPKPTMKDDDPISTIPRQIFGPLKRDIVTGIAASRIHSVVHTATSLYTFGKNEGQLGIVDSDARSLEMQVVPRKIAAALFSSSIHSVSAIDGATVCLLENREVWVFANYGYAKLSFPLDGFTSNFLKESWLTTKYDTAPNKISKITSGGDTICALSTSGEVFTVAVSRRSEGSQDSGTSTTNPKQIRGALSAPFRIWSSKKSHMAARDVDVDQDGSIILTTEVGSVWRRTKRATIKNANITAAVGNKPKDYKFQRVSGLTRVIAVRASAFGAYAAIRKDCNVTRTQIGVDEAGLWEDLAPLLSFHELTEYEETSDDEEPAPRFWARATEAQGLRKRVLKSKDLEAEIIGILHRSSSSSDRTYNMEIGSTLSDVRIPVHEFVLAGRSRILRDALLDYRVKSTDHVMPDLLTVKAEGGRLLVLFQGLDFLTIFNLVLYAYTDSVIDFWNVTRHYPTLAHRYRSVRTELMKVASRLELRQLEPAVRQMVKPRKSLHMDMELAIKDTSFFESGDVIVDLADGEMLLHSDVICQRCPFFEGMFRGRAAGQWLEGRRTEESPLVHIDLSHVEKRLFELVVRHLYTDAGEEIFEDVTSEDLNDLLALDELLDHVMDIMSVANELMLDRLTQICQRLIGRYVNARNVCSLLTAVAPSSVAEFKDAALEYVCLSLEAVMQNGSLDELDEDLLLELNQVAHENQLAYLPFARSGRAETLLFDRYPELAERIERGKRAKVDAIVLSNKYADGDGISTSFRAQSLEEVAASPLRQRNRRRASKEVKSPALTPALKSRGSVPDLMFDMSDGDEYDDAAPKKIKPPQFTEQSGDERLVETPVGSLEAPWGSVQKPDGSSHTFGRVSDLSLKSKSPVSQSAIKEERPPGQPWGIAPLAAPKLDLKDIMAQDSSATPSNLTIGLSRGESERIAKAAHAKLSQKERKRLQQAQQLGTPIEKPQPVPPTVSPWQATAHRKPSNSPAISPAAQPSPTPTPQPSQPSNTPHLTMRQTVANKGGSSKQKDKRSVSKGQAATGTSSPSKTRPIASERGMSVSTDPIPTPRSVRHIPLPQHSPTSPSQHLSMMEILSLQEAEKTLIRDAAAKRSLQEIQQEQEFQQWWDQESRRVIEEEAQTKRLLDRAAKAATRGRGNKTRSGRGGKAKDQEKKDGVEDADHGKGKNDGSAGPSATTTKNDGPKATFRHDGGGRAPGQENAGRGGRGRIGRGGRAGARGGRAQGTPRDGTATSVQQGQASASAL